MKESQLKTKRICLIATAPALLYIFNRNMIPALLENGWEATGLTSKNQPGFGDDDYYAKLESFGLRMTTVPISRDPSPLLDLWCLLRLWWFFLWHRFDVVHASNPKAMLLGTLAAFFAFHPNRVITVRGRVYENTHGWKRKIFVWLDRLTCFLANRVIVVSHSLKEAMLRDGIGTKNKLCVIAHGSSQGCDAEYFCPEQMDQNLVHELRRRCNLAESDCVILFAGRLRKDKGVVELVQAFTGISSKHPDWHLVLFGHEENASDIGDETRMLIRSHEKIHHFDWSSDLRMAYKTADIFAIPTWREGFPNTVLEASAMRLPVVTTTAVGAVDSVLDGETGFLVPVNDAGQLAEKLQTLIDNPELRETMGPAGRNRVLRDFQPQTVQAGLLRIYESLLRS
ncbi:MAG: glycosyltransferase family 4 protein [Planctomycetaceae bacterium]|nr:glycosyltransferase family 4 protein [Planctomycetaceae bacterium]